MLDLARIAQSLVATGKGILDADETPSTLTRRLDAYKIPSTPTSRRDFRMLLLTTRGVDEFISGVILQDEMIRQQGFPGEPIPALCTRLGILPGIKVDAGARPLAGHDGAFVTDRAQAEEMAIDHAPIVRTCRRIQLSWSRTGAVAC